MARSWTAALLGGAAILVVIAVIHSQDNQLSILEASMDGETSSPTDDQYWPSNLADEDNHALVKRTEYEDAKDPTDMPLAEAKADITAVHDNHKVAQTVYARYKWIKRKQETKEHHAKTLKKEMAEVFRTAHMEVEKDSKKAYIKAHPHSKQAKAARKKHLDAENAAKKAIMLKKKMKEKAKKAFKKSYEADNKLFKGIIPEPAPQSPAHAQASLKKSVHEVDAALNKADKIARHAKMSAAVHKLKAATDKVYATISAIGKHKQEVAASNLKDATGKVFGSISAAAEQNHKAASANLKGAIQKLDAASDEVFKGSAKGAASSFAKSILKVKEQVKADVAKSGSGSGSGSL